MIQGQVFGITGGSASGKSSLISALLGHTAIESGVIIRNGKFAYFPETPYLENDESVLNNVIFYQKFNKERYENALEIVLLGKKGIGSDPICEDSPIGQLELSAQQMQKISLARSIFCDRYYPNLLPNLYMRLLIFIWSREIIILENPLSEITDQLVVDDIFRRICAKLIEMGKTVIVASQNDNVIYYWSRRGSRLYLNIIK